MFLFSSSYSSHARLPFGPILFLSLPFTFTVADQEDSRQSFNNSHPPPHDLLFLNSHTDASIDRLDRQNSTSPITATTFCENHEIPLLCFWPAGPADKAISKINTQSPCFSFPWCLEQKFSRNRVTARYLCLPYSHVISFGTELQLPSLPHQVIIWWLAISFQIQSKLGTSKL